MLSSLIHYQSSNHTLCQILLDGELRHIKGIENYGGLGAYGENILVGGYWDRGWGVFVATPKTTKESMKNSKKKKFLTIPLNNLKGILLPSPIVEAVGNEFPEHKRLLKGYGAFAQELEISL